MQEIVTELMLELQQNIADNAGTIDYERYEADLLSVLQNLKQCNVGSSFSVYEALYNPMTWESGYVTISVHLSKEGAEKAIAFHKMEKIKEWQKSYPEKEDEPYTFGAFEDWSIREIIVQP